MGGQAQVVTFALDALLSAGEQIDTVLVLHFSSDDQRVKRALKQLSGEFSGDCYAGHPITYRRVPISDDGGPLDYVCSEYEAEVVWQMARDLLVELKMQGRQLHVCIAGGPRILALTLTSAALLQCDHRDSLWHLYTPRDFIAEARDGRILHAPEEIGVRLIPVPMAPLGSYFPLLRQLARPAPDLGTGLTPDNAARCQAVWSHLTTRQRDVLEALAKDQLPQDAADALYISLKTLDAHKTEILAECRVAWNFPENKYLDYHFIRENFASWFALRRATRITP